MPMPINQSGHGGDVSNKEIIPGGNTDLQGFVQRFSSDLRELLPEHSMIINVCPYRTGNHSWNTVMGANAVRIATPYGQASAFLSLLLSLRMLSQKGPLY